MSEGNVAALDGQVRAHLAESNHDTEANGTHDGVAEKEAERATVGERTAGSEEKTGTDDTADGNHR